MDARNQNRDGRRATTGLLLALGALLLPAAAAGQQAAAADAKEVSAAGAAALASTLRLVRDTGTLSLMGLRSAEEAAAATLGEPLPIREVGFDRLLAYTAGSDPETVFGGPPEVAFPVLVRGEVRSSITLVRKDAGWAVTSFGEPERAAEIGRVRDALQREAGGAASYALVTVPAFQVAFVARTRGGATVLREVGARSAADLGIEGQSELGAAVARLADRARDFQQRYGDAIRQRRIAR
jgi:hypothetical protein